MLSTEGLASSGSHFGSNLKSIWDVYISLDFANGMTQLFSCQPWDPDGHLRPWVSYSSFTTVLGGIPPRSCGHFRVPILITGLLCWWSHCCTRVRRCIWLPNDPLLQDTPYVKKKKLQLRPLTYLFLSFSPSTGIFNRLTKNQIKTIRIFGAHYEFIY